jgi:hypothetical protein
MPALPILAVRRSIGRALARSIRHASIGPIIRADAGPGELGRVGIRYDGRIGEARIVT